MKTKNILYYYLFFSLLVPVNLLPYDQAAIDALNAGTKSLTFKDFRDANLSNRTLNGIDFTGSILTGINFSGSTLNSCDLSSVDISKGNLSKLNFNNCTLSDVDFTESNLSESITNSSNLNRAVFVDLDMREASFVGCTYEETVLLKVIIEDSIKNFFVQNGSISESCSFMINSDTHSVTYAIRGLEKQLTLNDQKKQINKMYSVAVEKNINGEFKNKITKIIYIGDNTDSGDQPDTWQVFDSNYLKPYRTGQFSGENEIETLLLIGNHDRYPGELISDENYATYKIKEVNNSHIQNTGDSGEDYYKVYDIASNLDIYMLSECPTRNGYKPVNWFQSKFNKNKNCIIAGHYYYASNLDWWTAGNEPRYYQNHGGTIQQDIINGTAVMSIFVDKLTPYNNNIKLYLGGHDHSVKIKRWTIGDKKIWALDSAGRSRFSLVHFESDGNIACIEIYHIGEWEKVLRFFPQLEDSSGKDGHKTRLIVKYFMQFYGRFPTTIELNTYLDPNHPNTDATLWETFIDIKTQARS